MSAIDRIVAALHRSKEALERAAAHGRVAVDRAEEARELGEAVGVHSVVERFERIRESAERVEAMLAVGMAMAREAIARAEAVRGDSATEPATAGEARLAGSVAALDPRLPEVVRRAANALPVRQQGDPTNGVALIGEDQVKLRSGRDESMVADLHPALASYVAMTDHVESHVAARMRRDRVREATLVINNEVCEGRFSCDRLLPDILPIGSRLTLYERVGGVVRLRRVYSGTGRGIV